MAWRYDVLISDPFGAPEDSRFLEDVCILQIPFGLMDLPEALVVSPPRMLNSATENGGSLFVFGTKLCCS